MKKFISSALALTLIASVLAGCSSNTASTSDPGSAPESSTPSSQVESNIQEEQTNTEKALALIGTFASGDTETARELLDENYIQHNLAYGTGEDAFIGSVEYLASADGKTTVENIRSFEDGDYVFLQTVYNFAGAGEQVAFDIFRFDEDGEIAEHPGCICCRAEPPRPHPDRRHDGSDRSGQDRGKPGTGEELPLRCDAG